MATTLLICGAGGCYGFWFYHRSQPAALRRELFAGVVYERDVRQSPRPLVIHVVTIDVTKPGISFVVTDPSPPGGVMLRAKTTSQFLKETGCQIAINGGYFHLLKHGWGKDFPISGDPVEVVGLAASRGRVYNPAKAYYETLYMSEDNKVNIGEPTAPIYNAISGSSIIVDHGRNISHATGPIEPMTAVGLDANRKKLFLIVVDGKQPGYSQGVSPLELADLMLERGADKAMFFDGGGSSTLVTADPRGSPVRLSVPANMGIVGLERPVGDHLGIRVAR